MFGRIEQLGTKLLDAEGTSHKGPAVVAFLALTALLLGGVMVLGPYPITLYPTDTMHVLVHSDYLLQGYRPYVDYFSLYGPFPALFPLVGLETYGVSMWAILLSQVLMAALFGALMFKIAISRLHGLWAVVLAISVELLLLSCTPLGRRSWREFSAAMQYNAMCFSIAALIFLYVLLPSRSTRPASRWIDAIIVAFCLMATVLTKVSFFPPLVIILATGTILWPRVAGQRLEGVAILVMGALMTVGVMWSLGGSLAGYYKMIRSASLGVNPIALALRYVHHTRTIGAFLVCMALVAWIIHQAGLLKETRREWFLAFLMFGAMLLTTAMCKQDPESLPLIGVIPLAMTVLAAALAAAERRTLNAPMAAIVLLSALFLTVHDSKNSALSWVFSRMTIKTIEPAVERVQNADALAASLVSKRVDPKLFKLLPKKYVDSDFAALTLLKEAGAKPGEVLHVATIANGITVLTDLKYSHGESPWSPVAGAKTPTAYKPPVDDLVSDADWILRDTNRPDYWEFLMHNRGEYIDENFEEVAHKAEWILYRRKPRNANAPAAADAGGSSTTTTPTSPSAS
jgi:hypothetical protein